MHLAEILQKDDIIDVLCVQFEHCSNFPRQAPACLRQFSEILSCAAAMLGSCTLLGQSCPYLVAEDAFADGNNLMLYLLFPKLFFISVANLWHGQLNVILVFVGVCVPLFSHMMHVTEPIWCRGDAVCIIPCDMVSGANH